MCRNFDGVHNAVLRKHVILTSCTVLARAEAIEAGDWWWKLRPSANSIGPIVARFVAIAEASRDRVPCPLRASWMCASGCPQSFERYLGSVGEVHLLMITHKWQRRLLEAFLCQAHSALFGDFAKAILISSTVVCRNTPSNFILLPSLPLCWVLVAWKRTSIRAVTITSGTTAWVEAGVADWATLWIATINAARAEDWRSAWCTPRIVDGPILTVWEACPRTLR